MMLVSPSAFHCPCPLGMHGTYAPWVGRTAASSKADAHRRRRHAKEQMALHLTVFVQRPSHRGFVGWFVDAGA